MLCCAVLCCTDTVVCFAVFAILFAVMLPFGDNVTLMLRLMLLLCPSVAVDVWLVMIIYCDCR
jgi:hypothetical protein